MQVIEVEGLNFSYDDRVPVLEDISFRVGSGEFIGIVGPNGAGKTTLFKVLLGFIRSFSGKVKLLGEHIKHFKDWKRIGYVPQRLNVEQNFPATVWEMLQLVGDKQRIEEMADFLHIESFMDRQFLKLSGGQQQLVLLGMALSSDPDMLFLDEPTAGLDMHAQNHIIQILRELSLNETKTILMISHDIGLTLRSVDRVFCINRKLLYDGEPEGALETIENMFGIRRVSDDGIS